MSREARRLPSAHAVGLLPVVRCELAGIVNMKQVDVLQTVAWGMCHFGSLLTGRGCPRQDMLREKGRGMVKSVGMVPQCDDDGSIIETRQYREGWVLTEDGITQLRLLSPEAADVLLAADPCQACGAQCCKYVSIPVTELQELDVDWLIARGALEPGERGHVDWRIESRCPHLTEDNRCVIYDTRPETCRNYEVDGASCRRARRLAAND